MHRISSFALVLTSIATPAFAHTIPVPHVHEGPPVVNLLMGALFVALAAGLARSALAAPKHA